MRDASSLRERVLIFTAVLLFWVGVYLGIGRWGMTQGAWMLSWDPVRFVPRISFFVIPYLSAYIMPFVLFFVMHDRKRYRRFAITLAGTIAACGAVFLAVPLAIARPPLETISIFDWLLNGLYRVDGPTNLFPSLHVATAFLFAWGITLERPHWKLWMNGWAIAIALSTLFTRQHYFVDVLGGGVVAWVAWQFFENGRNASYIRKT